MPEGHSGCYGKQVKQKISTANEVNPSPDIIAFPLPEECDHSQNAKTGKDAHDKEIGDSFIFQDSQPESRI